MNETEQLVVDYFRPVRNYFWRWADKGEVIEWQDGTTICYREDLVQVLKAQAPLGIPSLGTLLLLLAACKQDWKALSGASGILFGCAQMLTKAAKIPDDQHLPGLVQAAIDFMDVVNGLPQEYRTGTQRNTLFNASFSKFDYLIPEKVAKSIITAFNSGHLDDLIYSSEEQKLTWRIFRTDLENLKSAKAAFRTSKILEDRLRTGVNFLGPGEEKILLPEPEAQSLLEQLTNDKATSGLAKLAKRLIPFLQIPLHSSGSSDQSFGGISDISNRGNFDRLLLTELAQDDITLLARLANNEALYLKKEELPAAQKKERILLLDITIRMWGTPRIFGLSALLACAEPTKFVSGIGAVGLSGTGYLEISLDTKEGIKKVLEQLDPGLTCTAGLLFFLKSQPRKPKQEYIFITEEWYANSLEFANLLAAHQGALDFMLVVNRQGNIRILELHENHRKQINSAALDLDSLLAGTGRQVQLKAESVKDAPVIWNVEPFPLFYPTSKVKVKTGYTYETSTYGIVGISQDLRVLHWPSPTTGARELVPHIQKGNYFFGYRGGSDFYIVVTGVRNQVFIYAIDLVSGDAIESDLSAELQEVKQVAFSGQYFYLSTHSGVIKVDPGLGTIIERLPSDAEKQVFSDPRKGMPPVNVGPVKRFINNGYSTLNKVRLLQIDSEGSLGIDSRTLRLTPDGRLMFLTADKAFTGVLRKGPQEVVFTEVTNPKLSFQRITWADGSAIFVDSRGILSFKSADIKIPEFSVLLILEMATAAWAEDGTVTGAEYFTGKDPVKWISPSDFYNRFLLPFTKNILAHATRVKV